MNYHNITKDDMLNGAGLRVCLWVSGCTHNCFGCHNPMTHAINSGILFDENAKEELFIELRKDYIDGITFTGGDPLHPLNISEITKLIKEVRKKFPKKTIWVYTGFMFEHIKELEFIKYIDVLCDSKFEYGNSSMNLRWVGSKNQRVIDVKETINSGEIKIL